MSQIDRLYELHGRTSGWDRELSRRRFLSLVAASAAVGYGAGCSQREQAQIMPYARRPAALLPGVSTPYATSLLIDGFATGLLAQTRDGRPIKIEGHPEHPASLGATSIYHQAAVLQLYDPDRASAVLQRGQPASWQALLEVLQRTPRPGGVGLRVLLEPTSSPLVHAQLAALKARYPASRVAFFAPLHSENAELASQQLFGQRLVPQYDLSRARCVAALDSDLLATAHDLRHARRFAEQRQLARPEDELNRLYAVEAALSITGGMADHRLARPSQRVPLMAASLAASVLPALTPAGRALAGLRDRLDSEERRFVAALARDLLARPRGQTLIIPGDRQPPEVHVLAQAMNLALGNLDRGVRFTPSALPHVADAEPLSELVSEMQRGDVHTLLVLGGNPAYDAPAELAWASALGRVEHSVYIGPYQNETARTTRWFGPLAHTFESWGDGRAYDGTLSLIQPLIRPLVPAKTTTEILSALAQQPAVGDHAQLRVRFGLELGEDTSLALSASERIEREDPEVRGRWEALLATGFARDSAFAPVSVQPRDAALEAAAQAIAARTAPSGLELNFLPSPTLHDGRFANVAWLLELPEPITKLTWDNAALISAATARELGLETAASSESEAQPLVELQLGAERLRIPALIAPGHADGAVSVWLGYGRRGAERLARGVGVDAYPLRRADAAHFRAGLTLVPLAERRPLALTQRVRDQHDRRLALSASIAAYRAQPELAGQHAQASLLEPSSGSGTQWAMTIDLSRCTGCSACVVACQAENNVPVVGREQVRRGREMHWLRIDSYAAGAGVVHQPMLCQHCQKAPCEYVCPVNATVHSPDGLNEMVYNRCIGTRFCSNNCPYKVRRFNWFDWVEEVPANQGRIELQRNPEVTVRERGVMEKCTYCVQRIRHAEIAARKEHRAIAPGEVVTACQQACPSAAIAFGSLEHEDSPVVQWRKQPRSYAALHETNAQPRTLYLARISNPNPELAT